MFKSIWKFLFAALILSSLNNLAYCKCTVGTTKSMRWTTYLDIRKINDVCGWKIPDAGRDKYQCICLKAYKNREVTCIHSIDVENDTKIWLESGGPADYVYVISTNSLDTMFSYEAEADRDGYNCDCSYKSGPGKKWNQVCGSL